MIKNIITIILIAFFLVVVITSFDLSYTGNIVKDNFNAKELVENTNQVVNDYNQKFENIPKFAKTLLGNERINLLINMNDGSKKELSFVTKEGKIISYEKKPLENPTMLITASESIIDSVSSSSNPSADFAKAIKNKSINIEPKKLKGKIKFSAAKIFIKIREKF